MKNLTLISFLTFLPLLAFAKDVRVSAREAIEKYGSITIEDGSSYYTFSKDGTFQSGPFKGISGRTFSGHWIQNDSDFAVTAELGWMNGATSTEPECWQMVFRIDEGVNRPAPKTIFGFGQFNQVFDSYFLINEMAKIPNSLETILTSDAVTFPSATNVSVTLTLRNIGDRSFPTHGFVYDSSIVWDGKEYKRDPKWRPLYDGLLNFDPLGCWRLDFMLSHYLVPSEKLTDGRHTISVKTPYSESNTLIVFIGR